MCYSFYSAVTYLIENHKISIQLMPLSRITRSAKVLQRNMILEFGYRDIREVKEMSYFHQSSKSKYKTAVKLLLICNKFAEAQNLKSHLAVIQIV